MATSVPNVKAPDLHKPRFYATCTIPLSKELIDIFREKFPKYKDEKDKFFRDIIKTHSKLMHEEVINSRDGVELPEGLGVAFIKSVKGSKKFNVDYSTLIKTGIIRKHNNMETDGHLAKLVYSNDLAKYRFVNREFWEFKGIRIFTRTIAKEYPKNWQSYIKLDHVAGISKLFKKRTLRQKFKDKVQSKDFIYNEFDMN